jgi:hypothetical protein
MKWSSKSFFFVVGVAALAGQLSLAEPRHDSGGGTFNLSRPSAGTSSSKKLSDAVNACLLGRGGSLSGSLTGTGINPGLGEIGAGIGTGATGLTTFPQVDSGGGTGGDSPSSLAPQACLQCHGPKNAQASIEALNGTRTVPAPMQKFLATLSASEKQEFVSFFEQRKAAGK